MSGWDKSTTSDSADPSAAGTDSKIGGSKSPLDQQEDRPQKTEDRPQNIVLWLAGAKTAAERPEALAYLIIYLGVIFLLHLARVIYGGLWWRRIKPGAEVVTEHAGALLTLITALWTSVFDFVGTFSWFFTGVLLKFTSKGECESFWDGVLAYHATVVAYAGRDDGVDEFLDWFERYDVQSISEGNKADWMCRENWKVMLAFFIVPPCFVVVMPFVLFCIGCCCIACRKRHV